MTDHNRELVLQRCPDAYCLETVFGYRIMATHMMYIGTGETEEAAWQSAARNLEVQQCD